MPAILPRCALLLYLTALPAPGAQGTGSIRGTVKDPSGAVVPSVAVRISGPISRAAQTDRQGDFRFDNLPPGDYSLTASAAQLVLPQPATVSLAASVVEVTLHLLLRLSTQELRVGDRLGGEVNTDALSNAGAVVLRGRDLDVLADKPEDLAADLVALAGPAAGPGGGALLIDGFSGGQLPSKDAIREIRINQNPFSPEFDKLGFGRIEIFTKPGSEKLKGTLYYNFADDALNSRNPYAARKAPFRLYEYGGSASGPLGKRASLFVDARRDSIDNGAVINGSFVDPVSLAIQTPYTGTLRIPQRRASLAPRLDYQLSANQTLTARYTYLQMDVRNSGVGAFNLAERGTHAENASHTVQLTETAVIGTRAVNETRFQFINLSESNTATFSGPAIQVLGAFNGGGNPVGSSSDRPRSMEFQNNTSLSRRSHAHRFGVRLRGEFWQSIAPVNFNGTFTFGGGAATAVERYQQTLLLLRQGLTGQQVRARGFGPSQFTLGAGTPGLAAKQIDAGLFYGDEWRARPNLTVNYGARYEWQTHIGDASNFAPRAGVAWSPKAKSKTVLRAGFGLFYDRFALANTLAALRYDGVRQRQFVVADPDFFPAVPAASAFAATRQTVQSVSDAVRAPLLAQTALAIERQLPQGTVVALTYASTHGGRMLRSRVAGAQASTVRFQMESTARYNQHQWIASFNSTVNKKVSLNGSYAVNRARSDSDGAGTFPANPATLAGEYGPAATDIRHRFTMAGSLTAPWDIRLNPLFTAESGPPFDITAGRDLYGTTLFNGRPALLAGAARPGAIQTVYGLLDPNPLPGATLLGRNFGRGPGQIMLNLRLSRTFAFGLGHGQEAPSNIPGGGERRADGGGVFGGSGGGASARTSRKYNIVLSMSIRNVLNHNNPGPIVGNIASPLFGRANQPAGSPALGGTIFSEAANNRRFELQTRFTF